VNCPRGCATTLAIADRGGIEIDYCPTCRGVWLDRGELDKLIERQSQVMQQAKPEALPGYREAWGPKEPRRHEPERPDYDDDRGGKRKKRRPFDLLEDIFDF
jgi:hypothetical protein